MSATVFVDTNVLVYARDRSDEMKQRRAIEWMTGLWELRLGRISVQVLQEYYVTVTRKLVPPREAEDAREDVLSLAAWQPAVIDLETIERGWSLQDRLSLSWWDALIFAAAQRRGCRYLLSEDFQDGLRVDGLTILDPFQHEPAAILEP
jgi:predicted nucleic acid-binding protein